MQIFPPPFCSIVHLEYHCPWDYLWNGVERLLLNIRTLCNAWETSLTTCCLAWAVVQGILASESATKVTVVKWGELWSTRYSIWSFSLVRKGMTCSSFRCDCGMLSQKSSMSQLYGNLVAWWGHNQCFCGLRLDFSFPLFECGSLDVGFIFQMKVGSGVLGVGWVVDQTEVVGLTNVDVGSFRKLISSDSDIPVGVASV